jgi:hypothetical protein
MLRLVRKIHIYCGLQACVALLIFAVAGIVGTLKASPWAAAPATEVSEVAFEVPLDASDRQVADAVFEELALPLSKPVPGFALRHDADDRLVLRFPSPNGLTTVTVQRAAGTLRVERRHTSLGMFLLRMHEETWSPARNGRPLLLWLWSFYVELSILSLLFLALSGVYQWLALRPRHRLAQLATAAGAIGFVWLWMRSQ